MSRFSEGDRAPGKDEAVLPRFSVTETHTASTLATPTGLEFVGALPCSQGSLSNAVDGTAL